MPLRLRVFSQLANLFEPETERECLCEMEIKGMECRGRREEREAGFIILNKSIASEQAKKVSFVVRKQGD